MKKRRLEGNQKTIGENSEKSAMLTESFSEMIDEKTIQ
jgi:hypothetical protein